MAVEYRSGMKFGRLTLVGDLVMVKGYKHWNMRCDCGTERIIDLNAVTSGRQSSCGCYRLEQVQKASRLKLAGQRIGMLTVRKFYTAYQGETFWICECDCGCGYIGRGAHLSRSRVTSCGCVRRAYQEKEKTERQLRKYAQNRRRRAKEAGSFGTFTDADVRRIYKAQKGRCPWCGISLKTGYHRDHKTPLALGGENTAENIELLCPRCNTRKHAKDPIAWANENGKLI